MEREIIQQERELSTLKADITGIKEQVKTLFTHVERQDKLIETVNNMALAQQKMLDAQGRIEEKVEGLCDDMDVVKSKPAKRWEGLVEKVILTAVGILVGALFAHFGIQ
jgi:hypothetical protein